MGEKLAQLGLVSGEVRELNIGSSFRENSTFHTIRYDFKPASVDPSQMGVLTVGGDSNNSVSVNVPHMNGNGVTHFGGHAKESNKRECILIYDAETGEFTLEKISSQILLKKTRPEKGAPPETPLPSAPPPTSSSSSSHHHFHHQQQQQQQISQPQQQHSFKQTSSHLKKQQPSSSHSNHRSAKPTMSSPAHRNASPIPRPSKGSSSSNNPGPAPSIQSTTYKQKNEDFSLDLDDEFDIMKSLVPAKTTSPRSNSSSSSSSYGGRPSGGPPPPSGNYARGPAPEKKPPTPPQPAPEAGSSSESSSSDSSSGSDSDSDDGDFQEVVSREPPSKAPSMPSFSSSPNPHGGASKEKPGSLRLSNNTATGGPSSMKAILNDDLQLSSESDDDDDDSD